MKRILLSMLALAAMTSCANQETTENPQPQDAVPIDLNAGVQAVTRAVVESGSFTFGIAGWETKETISYGAATKWQTTATSTVSPTSSAISWTQQPYYNADDAVKTYIQAWYPIGKADVASGIVAFDNTDGSVDALLSAPISGSKGTVIDAPLTFEHKTTQFIFKVKSGNGLEAGTKIQSIKIKNALLPTSFDFTKTPVIQSTSVADFAITGTETAITTEAVVFGSPVMIMPVSGQNLPLEVTTDKGGTVAVTATTADTNFEEGHAYTITLTVQQKAVGVNSSVTAWVDGTGSGTVE